jgi:hypothetical protein
VSSAASLGSKLQRTGSSSNDGANDLSGGSDSFQRPPTGQFHGNAVRVLSSTGDTKSMIMPTSSAESSSIGPDQTPLLVFRAVPRPSQKTPQAPPKPLSERKIVVKLGWRKWFAWGAWGVLNLQRVGSVGYMSFKGCVIGALVGAPLGPVGVIVGGVLGSLVGGTIATFIGYTTYKAVQIGLPNRRNVLASDAELALCYLRRRQRDGGAGLRFSAEEIDRLNALTPEQWSALLSVPRKPPGIPRAQRQAARSMIQAGAIVEAARLGYQEGLAVHDRLLLVAARRGAQALESAATQVIRAARPPGADAVERALGTISGIDGAGEALRHARMAFAYLTGPAGQRSGGAGLTLTPDAQDRLDGLDEADWAGLLDVPDEDLEGVAADDRPKARFLIRTGALAAAMRGDLGSALGLKEGLHFACGRRGLPALERALADLIEPPRHAPPRTGPDAPSAASPLPHADASGEEA